jgi:hypothetical protein
MDNNMTKPLVSLKRNEDVWTVEVDGNIFYEGEMRAAITAASKCSRLHNLGVSVTSNCWKELFEFYMSTREHLRTSPLPSRQLTRSA